ncbi:MAG: hypothetical protein AB1635_12455 [Acidobacteriota bacterium]
MRGVRYRLGRQDEIVEVGGAWDDFALSNEAPELQGQRVVGRFIWEFIADRTTAGLFKALYAAVRGGKALAIPFRCDGPSVRRYMQLQMAGSDHGGLTVSSSLVREECRPAQPILQRGTVRSDALLSMCSWCNRLRVDAGWCEVDEAVAALGLFEQTRLPQLTHGICEPCRQQIEAAMA